MFEYWSNIKSFSSKVIKNPLKYVLPSATLTADPNPVWLFEKHFTMEVFWKKVVAPIVIDEFVSNSSEFLNVFSRGSAGLDRKYFT